MQRGKLKPEDEKCLRDNYVQTKENIDALQLTDILYQEKVISNEDKEKINSKNLKSERNEILLQIVLDSGPGVNFDNFIDALKMNYLQLDIVKERSKFPDADCECSKNRQLEKHGLISEPQVKLYDITDLLVGEPECGKTLTCKTLMKFNKEEMCNIKSPLEKALHTFHFHGRKIHILDSPSIGNYRVDTHRLINEVKSYINKVSDGFHAFLLMIKYRKVMKNENLEIVKTLKCLYGPEILNQYCVLVVTHGDQLKAENASFKDWCLEQDGEFKSMYEECGRRAVLIDNTTEDKKSTIDALLNLIGEIDNLQFNGRRYTSVNFRKAEFGRQRILVEESQRNFLEVTATKCLSINHSSSYINTEFTEENVSKLKDIYAESSQLMGESTYILKDVLTIIKCVQETCSEKLKSDEKNEKKILKIDTEMERLMHELEKEKVEMKQEIMSLKEKISILKEKNKQLLEIKQVQAVNSPKTAFECEKRKKDLRKITITSFISLLLNALVVILNILILFVLGQRHCCEPNYIFV